MTIINLQKYCGLLLLLGGGWRGGSQHIGSKNKQKRILIKKKIRFKNFEGFDSYFLFLLHCLKIATVTFFRPYKQNGWFNQSGQECAWPTHAG